MIPKHTGTETLQETALTNYKKLPDPKTCTQKEYIHYYIQDELRANHIHQNFPAQNISDPTNADPLAVAIHKYFKILPLDLHSSYFYLWNNIYKILKTTSEHDLQQIYYPLFSKTEQPYIKILNARNQLAQQHNQQTFVDFHLLKTAKISHSEYQFFLQNKDQAIKFCQQQIPNIKTPKWFYSQFNNAPCFLCQLTTFPSIKFPNQVIDFITKQYPIIKTFRHKIKIIDSDQTSTQYLKHTDTFQITINSRLNNRHRITSLIHEMSHIIAILKNFGILSKNHYQNELSAIKIELTILKHLDPQLYQEKIASLLVPLYQTEFEMKTYQNPIQNIPTLYAKIINQHFPQAKQTKNYTYLINENFITHPLSNLPYAMASIKLFGQAD